MDLKLFAAGHAFDNGKPSQRAGCAVILVARDGDMVKCREISHYLGAVTGPQAELHGAYLALAAVKPALRSSDVVLAVGSYPARVLEQNADGYTTNARSNERLVERLRVLAGQFQSLTVSSQRSDEFTRAGDLARVSAQDQSQSDTGSQDRGIL